MSCYNLGITWLRLPFPVYKIRIALKVHKDKLQVLQTRAARVITGARFDVNSANVLEDLQWSTLDVRRHRLKSVLMYKILNE